MFDDSCRESAEADVVDFWCHCCGRDIEKGASSRISLFSLLKLNRRKLCRLLKRHSDMRSANDMINFRLHAITHANADIDTHSWCDLSHPTRGK